ncbi:hypothetical protein L6452_32979 [Arctium lappa]|uniref:Uncharacterized protein n=1 Tax=Arctium lappa TaxID=4217 RepID=A0ACB8Z573_ARCLA|nr:hypothetical protein L6452_32979 [Arctium lappa]
MPLSLLRGLASNKQRIPDRFWVLEARNRFQAANLKSISGSESEIDLSLRAANRKSMLGFRSSRVERVAMSVTAEQMSGSYGRRVGDECKLRQTTYCLMIETLE